ncbi:hypothetical protein RND81_01G207600 [Saponaria officinalis]|uniref:Uncharacterized protein n=1 Tax=Saponaria officinalis TaxID=3572 RepID=A0AAW1NG51_SAPOF
MTLLFKSKSCKLDGAAAESAAPPSRSIFEHEHETDDEEYEYEEEEEDEDEEYGDDNVSNPIMSTPFISPLFNKRSDQKGITILDFVVTTLRKSLLVTCSVEREELTSLDISCPTNVRHVSHVTFDRFNGFLGLPHELQHDLPLRVPSASASVFGVSPESMQCSIDERGNSVPTLLVMMQKRLYAQGGLQAEGIFRINAENSQEECVRSRLNKGVVPRDIDVHCLAGLIKAWFRELPKGVLDSLSPEQVMHCNTEDECTRLVAMLPPMEAGLLDWALNLMADVVKHEHLNKMNARNIAMVFAPNMTQMADPLTALIHAVQVMNLLKTLIERILRLRQESSESQKTDTHPSTSFGELIFTKLCDVSPREKPHNNHHIRSVSLDRLEFSPEHKHQKSREKYTEDGKTYASVTSGSSPVMSPTSVSAYEGGEAEGIFDRLNFRKGVKKLCRHPVFQLSK